MRYFLLWGFPLNSQLIALIGLRLLSFKVLAVQIYSKSIICFRFLKFGGGNPLFVIWYSKGVTEILVFLEIGLRAYFVRTYDFWINIGSIVLGNLLIASVKNIVLGKHNFLFQRVLVLLEQLFKFLAKRRLD